MNLVRSLAFNALFYLNTIIWLILALPTFFMPYTAILWVAKTWGRINLVLLRVIVGLRYEIRGREKIPRGAILVAAKHQSTWETFALLPLFDNPTFILKRELQWIPIFGWFTIKGRMVPIDRRAGVAHLYVAEGVPCLPIALNSGLFWPRRSLKLRPGKVVVEILDPIAPGLNRETFFQRLKDRIETATARLLEEGNKT